MKTSINSLNKSDQSLLGIILALLVVISPLLHVSVLRNPDLPRYPLLAATADLGLLAFALDLWHGRRTLRWHPLLTVVVAFFFWAMLSASWAQDTANYIIESTQLTGLVLIALLSAQIGGKKNAILLLLSLATISASIVAVLGLWQNYGFNPLGLREGTVMASTFYSKNHAAMYFDFILPVAFVLVLLAKPPAIQWLTSTGLALCGAYILSARCRGSWVGLTVSLLFLLVIGKLVLPPAELWVRMKERGVPLLLAVAFSVTIFFLPGQQNSNHRQPEPGHLLDTSSEVRLQLYFNALPMIADNPVLGTGLGSFRQAYRYYMHSKTDISVNNEGIYIDRLHNEPLQYIVELGIVGGLLAGAVYFGALRAGIVIMHSKLDHNQRLLALALTLGLVADGVHALFDFPYHKPSSSIQFWLSVGLLAGMSIPPRGNIGIVKIKKVYSAATILVALTFLAYNTDFYLRYLSANYQTLLATKYFKTNECAEAIRFIDQAEHEFTNYWGTHTIRTIIYSTCEGNPERRLDVMNEELAYEPTNALALLNRAELYRKYGFADLARDDYTNVTMLFPKRGRAYLGLARLALSENRPSEAITLLDQAILNEPNLRAALELRSQLLGRKD